MYFPSYWDLPACCMHSNSGPRNRSISSCHIMLHSLRAGNSGIRWNGSEWGFNVEPENPLIMLISITISWFLYLTYKEPASVKLLHTFHRLDRLGMFSSATYTGYTTHEELVQKCCCFIREYLNVSNKSFSLSSWSSFYTLFMSKGHITSEIVM